MGQNTRPCRAALVWGALVRNETGARFMGIQSILDRKGAGVITIRATETVKSAADRMRARSIAALVVTSCDAIAGLISERDIVHAVSAHGERALAMEVRDVAPQTIVTIAPDDTLKRAMSLMTSHRVRHLLVFADSKLVGIVCIGDDVKHRQEVFEHVSD